MKSKRIIKNTSMLMILNLAKMVFPFLTLPYLTRVLSTNTYGIVAYVKAVMSYMQIIVDFGFILSGTKNIVNTKNDKNKMEYVIGDTLFAKVLLSAGAGIILIGLTFILPILRTHILYTFLSYIVVILTIFLMDYLFRGIEEMHIITVRFVVMKAISTLLTFTLVKSDKDLLLIPILDIAGSCIAIILIVVEIKKMHIKIKFSGIRKAFCYISESCVYFASNVASTSFNVLNTIIIGFYLDSTQIAFWSVCIQIVCAVQALYTPISDAIYPEMIRKKNLVLIKQIMFIFMPIILVGCVCSYFLAEFVLFVLGGNEYVQAVTIFRYIIPVMFFGFPAILFGWPTLGAIGKTRETTATTAISVLFQISGVIALIACNKFSIVNIAILRSSTEFVLFITRCLLVIHFRNEFAHKVGI